MQLRAYLGIVLVLCLSACGKHKSLKEEAREMIIPVSVVQVKGEDLSKSLRLLGEIEPADSVAICSKVRGKLIDYMVKSGSHVEKGELVAYVDRDEVGYQYNRAPIYSPISGVISSLPLNRGSEVHASTPIGYVMNVDVVKAVFTLPERYHEVVKMGQPLNVGIDSLAKRAFSAQVDEINPQIDPVTHSFKIEAHIPNPDAELIPGMFTAADLILETFEHCVLLPEEAVLPVRGEWFIYTMASEQTVLKKVELGLRKEGKVQIVSGVEPRELVIVGGNHKVSDGQKVRKQL